jgi:1-acyl-sn-glycerol-3-phosphate acyltransferase
MELVYAAAERVLAPVLRGWFEWEVESAGLPGSGPLIVASNHVSFLDPFVVAYSLYRSGRRARFLAKAELFENPIQRALLSRLGQIPVRRGKGDAHALDLAEDAVWRGRTVVVFPEGTINAHHDGLPLLPFKSGTARLSIATGVPVTPIVTWGGQAVFPKGAKPALRRGLPLRVLVGEPVEPPTAIAGPESVRRFTEELAERMAGLVGKIVPAGP